MKVSDFIANFFFEKGITEIFGYPGGMVTHLMDSFSKYEKHIHVRLCYHEQAAAFAACGYAQTSGKIGVAYATSGPGATNLITGICNAYFDSVPVIFITGQVNTFESKAGYGLRQRGFQETNIVEMVTNVTKYAVYIESPNQVRDSLEKAYQLAMSGRKGPVLLDIPMDVQRAEIEGVSCKESTSHKIEQSLEENIYLLIADKLTQARRPCLLLGAGLKGNEKERICQFVEHMNMPVVTSMLARDLLPSDHPLNYGFIGAYGMRVANFVVAKSDLLLVLGSRMDVRQVGGKRADFAPNAEIIRIDIDENELQYKVRENEVDIHYDAWAVIDYLLNSFEAGERHDVEWNHICDEIAEKLTGLDERVYNSMTHKISQYIPENAVITTDVGQNQVWVAQSFQVKKGQKILFSGGHGAMGYSLPAAIGAYYATGGDVVCFNGDGGIQMNIQELEFIRREKLPIKIFVFNNYALGMIRHFQEMFFECNYVHTIRENGYDTPDFEKIAKAYDLEYFCYEKMEDISDAFMRYDGPVLVEMKLTEDTYVFPKLEYGKPNQDQEPLISRELYQQIMSL